ncbi:MAG: tetratricopeptide repeat protein [Desulfovibrio sp.]|nr:tetratricopeptide repeat protein [Desulfovibrio sp.]
MSTNLRLSFFCVLFLLCLSCFLLNNSGCTASKANPVEKQGMGNAGDRHKGLPDQLSVPRATSLSPEAQSTFAYLLCDQAFRKDDEEALLEASALLRDLRAPVQIWMEAGIWLLGRKSHNARFFLETARKVWPEDSSLLMLGAESLKEEGNIDGAITLVQDFLKTHPNVSDAKIELAILLVHKNKFPEAQRILASISKAERTPIVELNLGKALFGMRRFDEAISHLKAAKTAMPDLPDVYLELGKVYEQLGEYNKALDHYERLLETDFPVKNVLLKLISISLKLGKPERALEYLENAPDDIPFRLIAADMFIDAKNYLQASTILQAIAEQPYAPVEVYLLLADLTWEHKRDLNAALAWLDSMPESYNKSSSTLLLRTHLYARAGQNEKALETARRGKKLFPEETKFWEAEARILTSSGKTKEALSVMRLAVKQWPEDMEMLFLLGNILDESGDKGAALSLMEQIVQREPDNFQALNYVGYTLAEADRDLGRAVKLLEKAIQLAPDKAYVVDSLAWAYFKIGRGSDALREIRRAVSLQPTVDAAIWEHYGDIAKKEGFHDEARKAYKQALEMNPANAGAVQQKMQAMP